MNIEVKTEKPTIPPVKITIGEQTIEMSQEDARKLCDALCVALYGLPFRPSRASQWASASKTHDLLSYPAVKCVPPITIGVQPQGFQAYL